MRDYRLKGMNSTDIFKKLLTLVFVLFPSLSWAHHIGPVASDGLAAGPSFSCSDQNRLAFVEKMICQWELLRIYDRLMGDQFAALGEEGRQALLPHQRNWIETRNACADGLGPDTVRSEAEQEAFSCHHGTYLRQVHFLGRTLEELAGNEQVLTGSYGFVSEDLIEDDGRDDVRSIASFSVLALNREGRFYVDGTSTHGVSRHNCAYEAIAQRTPTGLAFILPSLDGGSQSWEAVFDPETRSFILEQRSGDVGKTLGCGQRAWIDGFRMFRR